MFRVRLTAILISFNLCALPALCAEWQSKATQEKEEARIKENSKVRDPLSMAVILYHRSQWKAATQAATQALSKPLPLSSKIHALELRSESYLNLNEYKQSLADINEAIRLRTDVPMNRYLRRANIESALDMHREAARDFAIVINRKIDKNDGIATTTDDLYYRKASCLFKCGDYRKAKSDYDAILKIDPDSEEAFKLRGDCHVALGQFALAVNDYTKAIENDTESPGTSYFARSIAYAKMGNKTQAAADKKRAFELGYVPKKEKIKTTK
jgi:tetratricopeptide (TPR) repeat protein